MKRPLLFEMENRFRNRTVTIDSTVAITRAYAKCENTLYDQFSANSMSASGVAEFPFGSTAPHIRLCHRRKTRLVMPCNCVAYETLSPLPCLVECFEHLRREIPPLWYALSNVLVNHFEAVVIVGCLGSGCVLVEKSVGSALCSKLVSQRTT